MEVLRVSLGTHAPSIEKISMTIQTLSIISNNDNISLHRILNIFSIVSETLLKLIKVQSKTNQMSKQMKMSVYIYREMDRCLITLHLYINNVYGNVKACGFGKRR